MRIQTADGTVHSIPNDRSKTLSFQDDGNREIKIEVSPTDVTIRTHDPHSVLVSEDTSSQPTLFSHTQELHDSSKYDEKSVLNRVLHALLH